MSERYSTKARIDIVPADPINTMDYNGRLVYSTVSSTFFIFVCISDDFGSGAWSSLGTSISGVSSVNALTGTLVIVAGSNTVVTPSGSNITIGSLAPVAFSGLPGSPVEGMLVPITDSNTGTFGATITAGSSTHHGLAYYDGTNWTFR